MDAYVTFILQVKQEVDENLIERGDEGIIFTYIYISCSEYRLLQIVVKFGDSFLSGLH